MIFLRMGMNRRLNKRSEPALEGDEVPAPAKVEAAAEPAAIEPKPQEIEAERLEASRKLEEEKKQKAKERLELLEKKAC